MKKFHMKHEIRYSGVKKKVSWKWLCIREQNTTLSSTNHR